MNLCVCTLAIVFLWLFVCLIKKFECGRVFVRILVRFLGQMYIRAEFSLGMCRCKQG